MNISPGLPVSLMVKVFWPPNPVSRIKFVKHSQVRNGSLSPNLHRRRHRRDLRTGLSASFVACSSAVRGALAGRAAFCRRFDPTSGLETCKRKGMLRYCRLTPAHGPPLAGLFPWVLFLAWLFEPPTIASVKDGDDRPDWTVGLLMISCCCPLESHALYLIRRSV